MLKTIIFLVIAGVLIWVGVEYGGQFNVTEEPSPAGERTTMEQGDTSPNEFLGIMKEDTVVGTGAEAKTGNTVSVHYVGTLTDGTKFDSSRDSGTQFEFTIGAGNVIRGWEEGIPGMKVGGTRKLTVPAYYYGYGDQGAGELIPPGATLLFEVELLGIK